MSVLKKFTLLYFSFLFCSSTFSEYESWQERQKREKQEQKVRIRNYTILGLAGAGILSLLTRSGRPLVFVRNAEAVVLERLGKYHRTLNAGLHAKLPFLDQPRTYAWHSVELNERGSLIEKMTNNSFRMDLRERVCHLPPQGVITKDNVVMKIDALVYFRVKSPEKAIYSIQDLPAGIEAIAQTTLRNEIGGLTLDETQVSREPINTRLREILKDIADGWGAEVTRVELQEVSPPRDITKAMEAEMAAERNRRAEVKTAEGKKQAQVLYAEGQKQSQILDAQARKEAQVLNARGECEAIEKLLAMAGGDHDKARQYLIAKKYLDVLPELAKGKGSLVVVPHDGASVANIAALASKVMNKASIA